MELDPRVSLAYMKVWCYRNSLNEDIEVVSPRAFGIVSTQYPAKPGRVVYGMVAFLNPTEYFVNPSDCATYLRHKRSEDWRSRGGR